MMAGHMSLGKKFTFTPGAFFKGLWRSRASALSQKSIIPESMFSLFSKIKDGFLVLLYKQNEALVINSARVFAVQIRIDKGGFMAKQQGWFALCFQYLTPALVPKGGFVSTHGHCLPWGSPPDSKAEENELELSAREQQGTT